jgi:uncharacterized membrane protein
MVAQFLSVVLLGIHIVGGSIALLSAAAAVSTKKGATQHRRFGKWYVIGMSAVFLTSIPLAFLNNNVFLFLIALFSLYLVFSGYRFAKNKSGIPQLQDWVAVAIMLLSGIGMEGMAYMFYAGGDAEGRWVILMVFGLIASILGIVDFVTLWTRTATGKHRIARHLTNMLSGTIATITAVLVVNVDTDPVWIAWLAPTVVITPLITYWNIRTLMPRAKRVA